MWKPLWEALEHWASTKWAACSAFLLQVLGSVTLSNLVLTANLLYTTLLIVVLLWKTWKKEK